MAENVNLQVFKKTTTNFELIFTEDGAPKDITDWTIYFTVKENMSDEDANAKIKYDIATHQDALNGKTIIPITQTDSNRTGSLHYDIVYKDDEGNVGVLYYGRILFAEKTTQRA